MIKQHYRVLKYIHKHKGIDKAKLLKRFPDFEDSLIYISKYLYVEDENKKDLEIIKGHLSKKANELKLNSNQRLEYIESNMLKFTYDDSVVFYSTKLSFQEYLEKKRHDTWLFWFPYTVTTVIAVISATPTVIEIIKYIFALFSKGTP